MSCSRDSTEQGPAITTISPSPILTPRTFTTVRAWRSWLLTSLKGWVMATTVSTPGAACRASISARPAARAHRSDDSSFSATNYMRLIVTFLDTVNHVPDLLFSCVRFHVDDHDCDTPSVSSPLHLGDGHRDGLLRSPSGRRSG